MKLYSIVFSLFLLSLLLLSGCIVAPGPPNIPTAPPVVVPIQPNPTPNPTPPPAVDSLPPSTPRGLQLKVINCHQIDLNWIPSQETGDSDLAGYRLFRNASMITSQNANSFSDTSVEPLKFYSYDAASFDVHGNQSQHSIAVNATTPSCESAPIVWAKPLGGSADERGVGAAIAPFDHIVSVVNFSDSLKLDSNRFVSGNSGMDFLISKYFSSNGSRLWFQHYGGTGEEVVEQIALDNVGDLVVVGYFTGSANFGDGEVSNSGGTDAFVAKYSGSNGSLRWFQRLAGAGDDVAWSVSVDSGSTLQDVVVVGSFTKNLTVASTALENNSNESDSFVVKFAGNTGNVLWAKKFSNAGFDSAKRVVLDSSGNLVLAGYFSKQIDFGGGSLNSIGGNDVYLAKLLGSNGTYMWSKRFGGTRDDIPLALSADKVGNIALAGTTNSPSVDLGLNPLSAVGIGTELFVSKYSDSGGYAWSKRFGGSDSIQPTDIQSDILGSIWVLGNFSGTAKFEKSSIASNGLIDSFLAKLNSSDGTVSTIQSWGGVGEDEAKSIAIDSAKNLVLSATFSNSIDFLGTPFNSNGSQDAILIKWKP